MGPQFHHLQVAMWSSCGKVVEIVVVRELLQYKLKFFCLFTYKKKNSFAFFLWIPSLSHLPTQHITHKFFLLFYFSKALLSKEQSPPHILKNIYTPYTSSPSLCSSSSVCFPFSFPRCNFQILSLVYACNNRDMWSHCFHFLNNFFHFCSPSCRIRFKKKKKKFVWDARAAASRMHAVSQTSPTLVRLSCSRTHAFLFQR